MHNRRRSRKKPFWTILAVLFLSIAAFLAYKYNEYNYFISTPVNINSTEEQIFTIKKGDNIKKIAENLKQKNLVLSAESFSLYARLNGLDKKVKTGRFPITQALNTSEILNIITSDQSREEIVTIPEGATIQDIDEILVNLALINPGEFIQASKNFNNYSKYPFLVAEEQKSLPHPLEGYLFPDTYYASTTEFSSESFLTLLLNTFVKKALPIAEASDRPLNQVLIVASMVEKEANRDPDRPIIAGIIWKRLDENWILGIDATLLYLKKDREIDFQDLQEDTPYNTRQKAGLPPGPIANPGLASIKAAASPEISDYYFYLTSREGDMVYARTNEEHNQNKAKYL